MPIRIGELRHEKKEELGILRRLPIHGLQVL